MRTTTTRWATPATPTTSGSWADRTSASTTTPPRPASTRPTSCKKWIRRAYRGPAMSRACPPRVTSCPSGDYDVNELPFAQFNYVADNSPDVPAATPAPTDGQLSDQPGKNPKHLPGIHLDRRQRSQQRGRPRRYSLVALAQFITTQFTDHQYNVPSRRRVRPARGVRH